MSTENPPVAPSTEPRQILKNSRYRIQSILYLSGSESNFPSPGSIFSWICPVLSTLFSFKNKNINLIRSVKQSNVMVRAIHCRIITRIRQTSQNIVLQSAGNFFFSYTVFTKYVVKSSKLLFSLCSLLSCSVATVRSFF